MNKNIALCCCSLLWSISISSFSEDCTETLSAIAPFKVTSSLQNDDRDDFDLMGKFPDGKKISKKERSSFDQMCSYRGRQYVYDLVSNADGLHGLLYKHSIVRELPDFANPENCRQRVKIIASENQNGWLTDVLNDKVPVLQGKNTQVVIRPDDLGQSVPADFHKAYDARKNELTPKLKELKDKLVDLDQEINSLNMKSIQARYEKEQILWKRLLESQIENYSLTKEEIAKMKKGNASDIEKIKVRQDALSERSKDLLVQDKSAQKRIGEISAKLKKKSSTELSNELVLLEKNRQDWKRELDLIEIEQQKVKKSLQFKEGRKNLILEIEKGVAGKKFASLKAGASDEDLAQKTEAEKKLLAEYLEKIKVRDALLDKIATNACLIQAAAKESSWLKNFSQSKKTIPRITTGEETFVPKASLNTPENYRFYFAKELASIDGMKEFSDLELELVEAEAGTYHVKECCEGINCTTHYKFKNPNSQDPNRRELWLPEASLDQLFAFARPVPKECTSAYKQVCEMYDNCTDSAVGVSLVGTFEKMMNQFIPSWLHSMLGDKFKVEIKPEWIPWRKGNNGVPLIPAFNLAEDITVFPIDPKTGKGPYNVTRSRDGVIFGEGQSTASVDVMGNATSICAFGQVAKAFEKICPTITKNKSDCPILLNDIFYDVNWRTKKWQVADHATHQNGTCFDILPMKGNIMWSLLTALQVAGAEDVYFNKLPAGAYNKGLEYPVSKMGGHGDHAHFCLDPQNPIVKNACANGLTVNSVVEKFPKALKDLNQAAINSKPVIKSKQSTKKPAKKSKKRG